MRIFEWGKPKTPLTSDEFSKLQNQIVELSGRIGMFQAQITAINAEMETLRSKFNKRNTKTPEENPSFSSGLPINGSKGINTFNPFG